MHIVRGRVVVMLLINVCMSPLTDTHTRTVSRNKETDDNDENDGDNVTERQNLCAVCWVVEIVLGVWVSAGSRRVLGCRDRPWCLGEACQLGHVRQCKS